MIVNGERKTVAEGQNVAGWLEANGYEVSKTAVLLNGKVVPRARMESTALKDGDTMEIVSFVGGG